MTTTKTLSGELTIQNALTAHTQLVAAISSDADIEIDLSLIDEIDSSGLQLLIAAKHEANAQNKTLRYVGHSSAVLDAFIFFDLVGFFGDPVVLPAEKR